MRAMMLGLGLLMPLAACSARADGVPAAGKGEERSFAVRDFTGVALRGSDDVDVKIASEFTVRATGPAKVLDDLVIERRGDTLRIGRKSRRGWNWGDRGNARIFVTLPALKAAAVAGSGDMRIGPLSGETLQLSNAGSGSIALDSVTVKTIDADLAGSGDLSARGTSERITLSIAGSGDIDMAGLKARAAKVSIAGSGSVTAQVDGDADVSILGSGDVTLGARARCKVSKMGSGTASCGGN